MSEKNIWSTVWWIVGAGMTVGAGVSQRWQTVAVFIVIALAAFARSLVWLAKDES